MTPIEKAYAGNILFVDDSKVNILMGRKMLSQFGLTVTTAENGLEAIECCKNDTFQLIFLDLEMPKVGGLAAATHIREEKLSYAPIYALTGSDGDEVKLLCRRAQMNGFVHKPLKKEMLEKILNKIL